MNDELPARDDSQQPEPTGTLIARLLKQQTESWAQGESILVEQILKEFPAITEDAEALLDLIHNEIYCRRKQGQRSELTDYQARFPALAEKIAIQWEVDLLLFDNSRTDLNLTLDADNTRTWTNIDHSFEVPEMLGSYKILEMLGQGGMGAVFKAHHLHLGKVVALKVLSPRVTERADSVLRFRREMKAVGSLIHPNIVQAFDAGEVNGIHYIAMELIEDIDLHRLVREQGPLKVSAACAIIYQVASALDAAHAVGVIHRDVKPSNMMLTNGQIKLLDLGLARLVEEEELKDELTSVTRTFGTPDFMAPEQWDDAHQVDYRADLYSLGCTLFYLLVGWPPYGTDEFRTASKKMKAHLFNPIPDLREYCPGVPNEVVSIFIRLMAKDPNDRFQSADELARAIQPYVRADALDLISTGRTTFVSRLRNTQEAPSTLPKSLSSRAAESKSQLQWALSRRQVFLLVALTLIVLGGGWYAYWGNPFAPPAITKADLPAPPVLPPEKKQADPEPTPSPSPPVDGGNPDVAKVVGTEEHSQNLWQLIAPMVVSDGRVEDVKVEGEVLSLDSTGASQQLWLDFQEHRGGEASVRMGMKIRNPRDEGYFKFVLLHSSQWSNEYYLQFRTLRGKSSINLSFHDRQGQQILQSHAVELKDEFANIELIFAKEQITASIEGYPPLKAPRSKLLKGTPAIAVSGWYVELTQPVVKIR